MRLKTTILLLAGLTGLALSDETALPCDPAACVAPDCRCSSTDTPGGIALEEMPQFVVLSFDDGVTELNYPFYMELSELTNPNECPVEMTFFVSHDNTDYTLVHDLHLKGHEIAVHSVTHRSGVDEYWRQLTKEEWQAEMSDQKEMLIKYGKIPRDKIKGFRAPFLEVGGDNMYAALKDAEFEYDCSWPSLHYTPWYQSEEGIKGALWPYTLDYESVQDQTVGTKPNASYPGLWVSPMTDLQDNRRIECAMLDGCQSVNGELESSSAAVTDLLKRNFQAHMNKKTPFGLYTHHSWFYYDDVDGDDNLNVRRDGFMAFMDYIKLFSDVYVVSVQQLIAWVKNPVPINDLEDHPAFQCSITPPQTNCTDIPETPCLFENANPINLTQIYMNICETPCPPNYPYLGNIDGSQPWPEN